MPNQTLVPPDFGVIHPDVLDRKSAFEFAGRHSKIAMEHAVAGNSEAAVHHHAQAKAYTDFLKSPIKAQPVTKSEKIVGGVADGKTLKDIAAHHKVDLSDLDTQFKMGQKVELEHTGDQSKADEIARDHLWEDPKYYSKLKVMEEGVDKCEDKKKRKMIEAERDRQMDTPLMTQPADEPYSAEKVENPVEGLEPLKKPVKKSMVEEWDLLKAKISANEAFLSVDDIIGDDEPQQGGDTEPAGAEQPQQDNPLSPEEEAQLDQHAQENPEDAAPADQPQDQEQAPDADQIAEMMRQEGYSDAEIAHVLHGHVPPVPTAEDHAAVNEQAQGEQERALKQREADAKHEHMRRLHDIEAKKKEAELASSDPELEKEHAKRLKELEFEKAKRALEAEDHEGEKEHKRKLRELELAAKQSELELKSAKEEKEHKSRMLALEYEKAKLEMELEIEFKKKEMALKLKQRDEMMKQSTAEKKELAAIKHEQAKVDAANPEEVEEQPSKKAKK